MLVNNQKGSILSVAIIMIAVLSFSLTTVTAFTINTAERTNRVVQGKENENESKRLIDQAIAYFEYEVNVLVDQEGGEIFNDVDFNTIFLDEKITYIFNTFNVVVDEVNFFDNDLIDPLVIAKSFRFSHEAADESGRRIKKYLHLSNHGVEYEEHDAFVFSLASNRALALNGGYYEGGSIEAEDGSTYQVELYGREVFRGYETLYRDNVGDYQVISPSTGANYPNGNGLIVSPRDYKCEVGSPCLTVNASNQIILHTNNYVPYNDEDFSAGQIIEDVFSSFHFDSFFEEALINKGTDAPVYHNDFNYDDLTSFFASNNFNIGWENRTSPFTDTFATTHLTLNTNNGLNLNGNVLAVDGNLTISNMSTIDGKGLIFVFGDLIINNNQNLNNADVAFIVRGDILIDYAEGSGFSVSGGASENSISLISKGNIVIESNSSLPLANGKRVPLFMFSESSILINSALHELEFAGGMYAQGKRPLDNVFVNDTSTPFYGILVNSFNGTINVETGEFYPNTAPEENTGPGNSGNRGRGNGNGNQGTNPGQGNTGNALAGSTDGPTFRMFGINKSTQGQGNSPYQNLKANFLVIPTLEKIVLFPNEMSSQRSTFLYYDN